LDGHRHILRAVRFPGDGNPVSHAARLAFREMTYRWPGLTSALGSVAVAVGVTTGVIGHLHEYDLQTQSILAAKEADVEARVTRINQDVREAMSKLGFNIVVLPKGQNLGDWYAEDYASRYMPIEYLDQLAQVKTLEHCVPCLRQKLKWPETGWTVILLGVGDRAANPIADTMPGRAMQRGHVGLGHEIHRARGLRTGDAISLLGKTFTVQDCRPERGTKDDVTIWLHLQDAQDLLDRDGLVNEIRALEAQAAWSDIVRIRGEVERRLPDTQVIEITDLAEAKTAARTRALEGGQASIEAERERREEFRQVQTQLALTVVSLVLLICTAWLSFLFFRNVRNREAEIGILLALGYESGQLVHLFLWRSLFLALTGGMLGFVGAAVLTDLNVRLFATAIALAVVLITAATCVPLLRVARHDPADILSGHKEAR